MSSTVGVVVVADVSGSCSCCTFVGIICGGGAMCSVVHVTCGVDACCVGAAIRDTCGACFVCHGCCGAVFSAGADIVEACACVTVGRLIGGVGAVGCAWLCKWCWI